MIHYKQELSNNTFTYLYHYRVGSFVLQDAMDRCGALWCPQEFSDPFMQIRLARQRDQAIPCTMCVAGSEYLRTIYLYLVFRHPNMI